MVSVNLYDSNPKELENFLSSFFNSEITNNGKSTWSYKYNNPVEVCDIIGAFIDNIEKFKMKMWVSLDTGIFINVDKSNANILIKYILERYPY